MTNPLAYNGAESITAGNVYYSSGTWTNYFKVLTTLNFNYFTILVAMVKPSIVLNFSQVLFGFKQNELT